MRRGMERRFQSGHPWVYSNELMESPKGVEPGAPVQLQDAGGKFLAWGYGNPKSLIAFRALSRNLKETDANSASGALRKLMAAGALRSDLGLDLVSHRLCFGEADRLPGLVIDCYRIDHSQPTQVFVVQAHTAGANRFVPEILDILKAYVQNRKSTNESLVDWSRSAVVLRNDLGVRTLEGLSSDEPAVLKEVSGLNLKNINIHVAPVLSTSQKDKPVLFQVDLVDGQKTGFFLDQFANIQMAAVRFQHLIKGLPKSSGRKIRILDLCCYVGQWGTQLARVFSSQGVQVEVVAVDASKQALEFAKLNIEREGARCETLKGDVLKDLANLESQSFDIVISDPPALIKSRKDIPTGKHAYLQLNTQVFRLVKAGGGVVCCSCSALLEEEVFTAALSKAAQRNQVYVNWVGRGCQSADHPMVIEFPEGRYLKAWAGFVQAEVSHAK